MLFPPVHSRPTTRPLRTAGTLAFLLVLAGVLAGQAVAAPPRTAPADPPGTTGGATPVGDPVARKGPAIVAAAGDISACDPPNCAAGRTASRILAMDPAVVLTLGDSQYDAGALAEYRAEYADTWGRFRGRTRPAPGNHEYMTPGARGYYRYFGKRAHRQHGGYYSFGVRRWHVLALNSNDGRCSIVACGPKSKQVQWLRHDLRASKSRCQLAYFHHPPWASVSSGGNSKVRTMWRVLARDGTDIVLNGHDHNYERFAPRGAEGKANTGGVRQFIVGTGGVPLNNLSAPYAGLSRRHLDGYHGVLRLALGRTWYRYRFVSAGGRVLDEGGPIGC